MRPECTERVRRAIDEIRAGRMIVLVDDEDRENEGDLCMAAERVTPEAINFMAKHGRGLICLTLTEERVRELDLPMMVDSNSAPLRTAFTVSIEARDGVTTGISAADRSHTIRVAVDDRTTPAELVRPGHVFPLKAKPGGVLQRTGQTEGSVDLARLAGLKPAGVICEIMNDDGTMARYADLQRFAEEHRLVVLSVADLIEYRLHHERLVREVADGSVVLGTGTAWRVRVFESTVEERQFMALTLGEPADEPMLVRVHTGSVLADVFRAPHAQRVALDDVLARMEAEGRGTVLFIPGRVELARDLAGVVGADFTPRAANDVLREFGFGAQVLTALGLTKIRLITNRPRRIAGLDSYGLEIVEQVSLAENGHERGAHVAH